MKKIMVSMPMVGLTEEQIQSEFRKKRMFLEGLGFTVVNTIFTDEWYSDDAMDERGVVNKSLCFLAKSLEVMSTCNAVYFCKGWDAENVRGCKVEHNAAAIYGIEIIYEETVPLGR